MPEKNDITDSINEMLLERRVVTPAMTLRLSRLFGNAPEFWLNTRRALDLWKAERENRRQIVMVIAQNAGMKKLKAGRLSQSTTPPSFTPILANFDLLSTGASTKLIKCSKSATNLTDSQRTISCHNM
jgi:predicted dinucleotide-binding enzyme